MDEEIRENTVLLNVCALASRGCLAKSSLACKDVFCLAVRDLCMSILDVEVRR